ncbi:MAG: DNA replication/repair protein RecF [Bacteroides sp.]|nr:DNA replication/repair protein RecF [Ruminococcus flavefaciens]MCM1555766.1 DNA replication/repair protein RecF [Bacteroides sp.]
MYLERLYINNFKNYTEAEIDFCPRINCLVGNNGSGKTNLLDAIYHLSFSKSYFGSTGRDHIRYGEEFYAINGRYMLGGNEAEVNLVQRKGQRKSLKFNKKECERMSDHVGRIPLVMISPQDQELIYGGSDLRRKFIDAAISQSNHAYLENLLLYNKALEQRNRLLKQEGIDLSLLEVFDLQLCRHGKLIFEERTRFIQQFIPVFERFYALLAEDSEQAGLAYKSSLQEKPFEILLQESAQKDRILQYTTAGIHKDDLSLLLNGHPIRLCGSQGQQKSYLLALRLSQLQYLAEIGHAYPILLLDDMFDKLDLRRINRLMELVGKDDFGQVFLSDTHDSRVIDLFAHHPVEHRVYRIENAQPVLIG